MLVNPAKFYDIEVLKKMDFSGYLVFKSMKLMERLPISNVYYGQNGLFTDRWFIKGLPWEDFMVDNPDVEYVVVIIGTSLYRIGPLHSNNKAVLVYIGEDSHG